MFTFRLEVVMEPRAGETAQSGKLLLGKSKDLRMIIRTHVHICNPGAGEVEIGSSLGLTG